MPLYSAGRALTSVEEQGKRDAWEPADNILCLSIPYMSLMYTFYTFYSVAAVCVCSELSAATSTRKEAWWHLLSSSCSLRILLSNLGTISGLKAETEEGYICQLSLSIPTTYHHPKRRL